VRYPGIEVDNGLDLAEQIDAMGSLFDRLLTLTR
jgi:hypothetical protein